MEVVITREQLESFNTLSSVIPKVQPGPDEVLLEPEKETNMEVSEKMGERSMDSEDFNSSGSPLKFEFLTLYKLQREGQWKDGRHGDKSDSILKAMRLRFGKNMERRSKAKAVYNCDTYLSAPPPSAIALFHFSPGWKDNRITLQERTRELEHLLSLADTLTNNSEMIWPQDEMLNVTVNERVENLISDSKGMQRDNTEGGRRFILIEDTLFLQYIIILDYFQLHDDNKSMMARLVRDSLSGDLLLPRLEAFTPIQMLLEIGIERFRRDMIHEFVMHGFITNEADLSAWVRASASPEDRAQALLPIHLALQTMLEVKKHLVITPHLLTNMTRSVLSKYCAERITDITKIFYETEVALIDVHPEIMQSALPQIWTNDTTYLYGGSIMAHTLTHFARQTQFEFIENKIEKEERLEEHVERADLILVYNAMVDSWQEAVQEILIKHPTLRKISSNKNFQREALALLFSCGDNKFKKVLNEFTGMCMKVFDLLSALDKLKHLKRTGWVKMEIPEPETVACHMYRMAVLAMALNGQIEGLDVVRAIKMSLVHDLAEAFVGDITPFCGVKDEDKFERESIAIQQIAAFVPKEYVGGEWIELWREYEANDTLTAKTVKHLDKFDMIVQAFDYEQKYDIDLSQFFNSTKASFNLEPFIGWNSELRDRREKWLKKKGC
uniref:Protein zwilch n=1 Tax=Heterorhabditis bacteriophora TaxID=37862 RepID=A0A1I7XHV6_HETBA